MQLIAQQRGRIVTGLLLMALLGLYVPWQQTCTIPHAGASRAVSETTGRSMPPFEVVWASSGYRFLWSRPAGYGDSYARVDLARWFCGWITAALSIAAVVVWSAGAVRDQEKNPA